MRTQSQCTPNDTAAEMELNDALERVGMKGAKRLDVACDNTKLIKIMAKKVESGTFSALIIIHLKQTPPHDFEAVCDEINTIQSTI